MKKNEILSIIIRYSLILILSFFFYLFYFILSPITIFSSYFLLKIFSTNISLFGNIISLNSARIIIDNACVAGAAYYLLTILNLTTPMSFKKRIFSLLFCLSSLLLFNLIRILIFSLLFLRNFTYFTYLHLLTWHIFSTIFIITIWILTTKIFKIKQIPIYTDVREIIKIFAF